VSEAQQKRVLEFIRAGVESGARLVVGGPEPAEHPTGWFVRPTVFTDVDPTSPIAQEEIFGPVLSIIPVRDVEHAIAVANDVRYGLAGAVWATDLDEARSAAERLEAGSLTVNGGSFNASAPYGGLKRSGLGHELGRAGIEEFLTTKVVHLP
jgi:aldehyde dehydrogenase (NAD+)